jgi:glutamine synthetase
MHQVYDKEKAAKLSAHDTSIIEDISDRITTIKEKVNALVSARKIANKLESEREKALAYHDNVFPYLDEIRYHVDKLELTVDDELWPLPKYRELLFVR